MGEKRVRLGTKGEANLLELRAFATRVLDRAVDPDDALDVAVRFIHLVEKREGERVVAQIRRETGPRLTLPSRPS